MYKVGDRVILRKHDTLIGTYGIPMHWFGQEFNVTGVGFIHRELGQSIEIVNGYHAFSAYAVMVEPIRLTPFEREIRAYITKEQENAATL